MTSATPAHGVLNRYKDFLPITHRTPPLSLGEGNTPLIPARRLASWVGVDQLYLKIEGMNPTGSFKDRGMVVAVAKAAEANATAVVCASTGNTSASAAAYAAHLGLQAIIILPVGGATGSKVVQAVACGAKICTIDGTFDDALALVRSLPTDYAMVSVNSINPHRLAGQATAAYEICDALGDAPDVLALPVGNGGNITAYWQGFTTYRAHSLSRKSPRMIGGQAAGAAPLVLGHPVKTPQTVASAIRIGNPASWIPAMRAIQESEGNLHAISDDDILTAYHTIPSLEGIFCEPASAVSVAALRAAVQSGQVRASECCVCVLTGHGLKDPDQSHAEASDTQVFPVDIHVLADHLGLSVSRRGE